MRRRRGSGGRYWPDRIVGGLMLLFATVAAIGMLLILVTSVVLSREAPHLGPGAAEHARVGIAVGIVLLPIALSQLYFAWSLFRSRRAGFYGALAMAGVGLLLLLLKPFGGDRPLPQLIYLGLEGGYCLLRLAGVGPRPS